MKTLKLKIIAVCSLIVLLAACKKNETLVTLPDGSVSFDQPAGQDTIQLPLSVLVNNPLTLEMKAAISGTTSGQNHYVTFAVDTTKINDYRAKYGAALLMPAKNYLFIKSIALLAAGTAKSEPAQLNIGQETSLTEYSTYVLPLVIKSVDGNATGTAATTRVVYYVFKTGKPLYFNKTGWTITSSSVQRSFVAGNLLDANNLTTYWESNTAQNMPQWVTISFNKDLTFTGLAYFIPTLLSYPKNGGYPTSFQIETSNDGITWVSLGVFAGNIVNNMQTVPLPTTTASYIRFTVLACAKYGVAQYDAVFISGISIMD